MVLFVSLQYFITLSTKTLVNSLQNDCDVFEKAVQHQYVDHKPRVVSRDREPSRVPVQQLKCLLHKSGKTRIKVREYVVKNVPMSSRMHYFVIKCNFDHEEVKYLKSYHRKFKRNLASGIALPRRRKLCSRHSLFNFYERAKIAKLIYYPQLLTNSSSQKNAACSLSRVHKTLNDRIIHNKFILSRDIAKNPGPHEVIYSNKTIYAPYS